MSYSYRAYGLGIESSIAIAGLERLNPPAACQDDLYVEDGPEPLWARQGRNLPGRVRSLLLESPHTADPSFLLTEHGNAECFVLSYSDGTRFIVDKTGRRVWGAFEAPLTAEDFATYLLGPVMGFLLRQRHITCLHASAVDVLDRSVAFCGGAGFGKSTTAAALALRGVPVLAEDIVPMKKNAEKFHALPGYPRVCLWPDAVAKLAGDENALPRLTPVWEKRYLALDGVRARFASSQLPLGLIYLFGVRSGEENAPRIEELCPREALLELVQNTYMNWLLDRERRAEEFDVLADLVAHVPVRRIIAHADPRRIGSLCDLILKDARAILSVNS